MVAIWNSMQDDLIQRKGFSLYGPLWVESIGHRWIPPQRASDGALMLT